MKFLSIDTDGDFGLKINGHDFWHDYIEVKAETLDLIDIQILPKNERHTKEAEKFIAGLKQAMKEYPSSSCPHGNWWYEFGHVRDWDLVLYKENRDV